MSLYRTGKFLPLSATILGAVVATGCGSDGSRDMVRSPVHQADDDHHPHVARAALSEPVAGSVTQSTRRQSGGNVSLDRVEVEGGHDRRGNWYRLVNTPVGATEPAWVVDTRVEDGGEVLIRDRYSDDHENEGHEFGAGIRKRIDDEATLHLHVLRIPLSFEEADLLRDDVDYFAAGLWVFVPDDDNEEPILGAFADGNNGFDDGNLAGLTGNARYALEDGAFGIYSDPQVLNGDIASDDDFPSHGAFTADVELTAEFGDGNELGMISGRIHRFKGHGDSDDDGTDGDSGMRLVLEVTPIGSREHGFSTGDTRMQIGENGRTLGEGKWGAQFLGNGASPTDVPRAVVGTFGAAAAEGELRDLSMVGGYIALHQPTSTE